MISFWKENTLTHGWREFTQGSDRKGFYYDPDSGPVISDIGAGATGLGIGAARAFGDHEKISALTTQLLASATPLLSGRFLVPSLVADQEHAPLFPEIVIMHQLSISSHETETSFSIPPIVLLLSALQALLAFFFLRWGIRILRAKPPAH